MLGRSVGPCEKYKFLGFLTRAPGPRDAPGWSPGLSVGLPGASGGLPEAPGPKTDQSKKLRNLTELTEQWSMGRTVRPNPLDHCTARLKMLPDSSAQVCVAGEPFLGRSVLDVAH